MSLEIGNYVFEGPYDSADALEHRSGLFVVFCRAEDDFRGLDCGSAADVAAAVTGHPRRDAWQTTCSGTVVFAVLYAEDDLELIEAGLRTQFKFPCRDAVE
mgnify:FL=1